MTTTPARAPRVPPASTFAARLLRELDRELAATLPRVSSHADGEAVHDMRVAIRKTRTLLKCVRPLFGRFHADSVRAAYTVLHRATGTLRDEEVFRETLDELGLGGEILEAFRRSRARREAGLRRHVVALVRAKRVDHARRLLDALLTLPIHPKRERAADQFARRMAERARQRVERQRDADPSDVVAMHDLRIAYKELRYVCELFGPVLPSDVAEQARGAARFQKRIGELHDVDMALAAVTRSRLPVASKARVLAALRRLRARRVEKYVAEMAPAAASLEPAAPPPAPPRAR